MIAQVNGAKVSASDFMPRYGPKPDPVERTDEELLALAIKANALMSGKFVKQK